MSNMNSKELKEIIMSGTQEMANALDSLTDEDFFEVFALLAENHDMDISEKDTDSIDTFTKWLNAVLYEIRDKDED